MDTQTDSFRVGEIAPGTAAPKRRGRAPGSPKPAGSGRKRGGTNWASPSVKRRLSKASAEFLADLIEGKVIDTAHPVTGKLMRRRGTIPERLQGCAIVVPRFAPALQSVAQEIDQTVRTPDTAQHDPRQIARAFLSVLHRAKIGDREAEGDEERSWRELDPIETFRANGSEMNGAAAAPQGESLVDASAAGGSLPAHDDENASAGKSDSATGTEKHELGERIMVSDHWIECSAILNDGRTRWQIFDNRGQHHGNRTGKDVAERACRQLVKTGSMSA